MVVFFVDIVEGKYLPKERGDPKFEAGYGSTGGLMMQMKKPLFGTGKAVVVESGFYVLKVLVGMLAHEVNGTTLIIKRDIGPSTAREMPL